MPKTHRTRRGRFGCGIRPALLSPRSDRAAGGSYSRGRDRRGAGAHDPPGSASRRPARYSITELRRPRKSLQLGGYCDHRANPSTFTERDVVDDLVYVLGQGREPVGVYRVIGNPPEGELSDLWLDPSFIGRSLGRRLFRHALDTAAGHGYQTLIIESDPNAEGFYTAMGAGRIGDRRSASGRILPLLRIPT
jgi:GNAT superfamily N-acetyltransferase